MTATDNVEATWDAIAESFDKTRRKPWPRVLDVIATFSPSDVVVDVGCGNGRHILPCIEKCNTLIGIDVAQNMLTYTQKKINHAKNVTLIHASAVKVPIASDSVDTVLFIAAVHNIQGKQNRLEALHEVKRILKPGGSALVSVWSRWQDRFRLHFLREVLRFYKGDFGDIDVLWNRDGLDIFRYYHLYSRRELCHDLHAVGFKINRIYAETISSKRHPDNYFALVYKK